jgi:hypothetical protein
MTKITERFLSDNYWWCVLTYCRTKGAPYDHCGHSIQISYAVSKKFARLGLDQQGKDHGRHRFFRFDRWNHPLDPPSLGELLELEVEDVIETRFRDQLSMYSRTDRYWTAVMSHHFPDWDERAFFANWVRDQIGLDRQIEEVKKEWEEVHRAEAEAASADAQVSTAGAEESSGSTRPADTGPGPDTTAAESGSSSGGTERTTSGSAGSSEEEEFVEAAIAKYEANKSPDVRHYTDEEVAVVKAALVDQIDKLDAAMEFCDTAKGKEPMTQEEEEAFVKEVQEIMKPATFKIRIGGK